MNHIEELQARVAQLERHQYELLGKIGILNSELQKAQAKCAEMRTVLEQVAQNAKRCGGAMVAWSPSGRSDAGICCADKFEYALSSDCGKSILEKVERLRCELTKCRDFFERRNPAICSAIERTLKEIK